MNREIKFRAWFPNLKLMETNLDQSGINVYTCNGDGTIEVEGTFQDEDERGAKLKAWTEQGILLQFTGLLDKNGKEIYEGDIVKQFGNPTPRAIEFFRSAWRFQKWIIGTEIHPEALEVLGNIYENPELVSATTTNPAEK